MAFVEFQEDFRVETIVNGVSDEVGDKLYEFRIISHKPFDEVKKICMEQFQVSFEKGNKPHLFSPELIEFKKTTDLGFGIGEMYRYKFKKPKNS
ncbi:hypothetical protein VC82_2031 [Flagellimonas lutaonensis]|uniref:Uncharacterized protein n=2 Tax=Flagellimonas lutaonensis TaxID=516051 RepID=A0A0D5YTI6_9FLAO|nr:hypothetical protein VC82_2031 [Allomuricauda lutaonensis]